MRALNNLFLWAYNGLWHAACPLLRRHKRLKENFEQRLVPEDWIRGDISDDGYFFGSAKGILTPEQKAASTRSLRVWIQAASGGEAWLVHCLVSALAEALSTHPALAALPLRLICTSCTRQGLDILEKLAPLAHTCAPVSILARHFPLDRPELMRRAIAAARPDAIVLLETELWPGLLAAASERSIPVLALNARMTEKSFKAYSLARFFWSSHAPERVLAISPEDADRFARLFGCPERVGLMPNIKFDRVAAVSESPASTGASGSLRMEAGIGDTVLLAVLASVREEEEYLLLPVVSALHGMFLGGSRVVMAIAPRHLHRVNVWLARLKEAALPCRLRSTRNGTGDDTADAACSGTPSVYVWDTFGELNTLYAIADAIFVGASLVPLGGQNFLEPLAQGLIPLVGPHIDNFHWIGEELFTQGLVTRLSKTADLRTALENALSRRLDALGKNCGGYAAGASDWQTARAAEAAGVRRRFSAWLVSRQGGSRQAAEALAQVLAQGKGTSANRF